MLLPRCRSSSALSPNGTPSCPHQHGTAVSLDTAWRIASASTINRASIWISSLGITASPVKVAVSSALYPRLFLGRMEDECS